MDAHTLKGMAIVSVAEGTKLGQVEQPLLDLTAQRVAALRAKGESGTFIVRFEDVQSIGADAITVASSAATRTPSTGGATDGLRDLDELGKLKVVDGAGTFLGMIAHIEFDPASGAITQLAAHKGGMLGMGGTTTPIDARAIVSVGPELLTAKTEATVLSAE
jgi:uncharacterized protein YrrD